MGPTSPSVYGTPSPEARRQDTPTNIDESENMEANRAAKVNNKRYWTQEEEERLVQFYIL
jgi:hypothetical protein